MIFGGYARKNKAFVSPFVWNDVYFYACLCMVYEDKAMLYVFSTLYVPHKLKNALLLRSWRSSPIEIYIESTLGEPFVCAIFGFSRLLKVSTPRHTSFKKPQNFLRARLRRAQGYSRWVDSSEKS